MHNHVRLVLKGCKHCQGDLLLDVEATESSDADIAVYACLQCGRTARFIEEAAAPAHTLAAA